MTVTPSKWDKLYRQTKYSGEYSILDRQLTGTDNLCIQLCTGNSVDEQTEEAWAVGTRMDFGDKLIVPFFPKQTETTWKNRT